MSHTRLHALLIDGCWCAPRVGLFRPTPHATDVTVLGIFRQCGREWELCLPYPVPGIRLLVGHAVPVEYATPVAVSEGTTDAVSPISPIPPDETFCLYAPCAGFLQIRVSGRNIISPGQLVRPGTLVAIIEMMKLGVDIVYEGERDAVLISYSDRTSVQKNDPVCKLQWVRSGNEEII